MKEEERKKLAAPLRDWLQRLNKAEAAVQELMRPHRDAIAAIDEAREEIVLFMENEGVILGTCMDCLTPLIEGDKGYCYAGGEMCCAECSPTFAEVRAEATELVNQGVKEHGDEAIATAYARLKAVADHVAGGGALSDKQTWEL